ncbi:MAG: NADH-quinone oxidoreductase subunit NuoG [Solirubrobacteraceae bacterium]
MARKAHTMITFTIDGVEVQAPENTMLVDAAKHGDVEIPVFCYEPKLGQPVGACRMCLVEIEGIPKLQTGCSTPVKDGMVVHTRSDQVKVAQSSVVEFLLVNHPLDCPVCDKGGECPLQDITFGWGPGTSRTVEPKRHFRKPVELSPLVAIDRERCILCYRCARFSQDVSEDHQLVLLERGAHSYISTFDGHPYVAPFSGNIVELCPVGALTSIPYRFRARPWDIEGSGSVCSLCPAQCNISFTVRDDRVMRVLARDNAEVDDGWLCDKGRFAYQAIHVSERITEPMVRDGGELRAVSWERALAAAGAALRRAGPRSAAIAGGQASNEEGYILARLLRDGLGSEAVDSVAALDPRAVHALASPQLQATVSDVEHADAVLVVGCEPINDIPILDLRIRKGVRGNGVKLAVAGAVPSALEARAALSVRHAKGADARFLEALVVALDPAAQGTSEKAAERGGGGALAAAAHAAGADPVEVRALAELLRGAGEEIVVIYGQRVLSLPGDGVGALLRLAGLLGMERARADAPAAGEPAPPGPARGLFGVTAGVSNGRGLLEAGVAPGYGPGYTPREGAAGQPARSAGEIGAALANGELELLYLLHTDPLRSPLPRELFERAMGRANTVIAHAEFLTEGLREHADVVFPAESYAEKEGTVVHPDGRLQRLRPAIGRQGATRAGWWVLAELARMCGMDLGLSRADGEQEGPGRAALRAAGVMLADISATRASEALFEAVPIYAGITLEDIGGRGMRWQERPAAASFPQPPALPSRESAGGAGEEDSGEHAEAPVHGQALLWDSPEVEFSPALSFLFRKHVLRERGADGDGAVNGAASHVGATAIASAAASAAGEDG